MSIRLSLQRITPDEYQQLIAGNADSRDWNPDGLDERLDKSWDVMYHLLVDGAYDAPPRVAKAITGDVLIAADDLPYAPPFGEILVSFVLPDGSTQELPTGGMGALSAELVREIANDLEVISDEEFTRRVSRARTVSDDIRVKARESEIHPYPLHCLQEFYRDAARTNSAVALWVG